MGSGWGVGMGGIETMATAIGADLAARLPRQNKKQREGLALLVATALDVRDVNLMELAAALPRAAERLDMRYQWISRLLRQLAHRHRRGDGALCPRGAGARQCTGAHACADHRPEPGQRHAPDGYGIPARGRARCAARLAGEEHARRHRLC